MQDAIVEALTRYVIITISVNFLMIGSIIAIFLISQRKKTRYLLEMQQLREQQQNMLIEAAVKSEESERHRIAEELHDEVGALLSATKLHFSAVEKPGMAETEKTHFQKSKELLDYSIKKVRSISHSLHSGILKELGLNEAIRHFVQVTTGSIPVTVSLQLDENIEHESPDREITVYRLFQELLNNILKHSNATTIAITARQRDDQFELILEHDGKGLSQEAFERLRYEGKGLGLKNIQNRIILLKGYITYDNSGPLNNVIVSVPLKTEA